MSSEKTSLMHDQLSKATLVFGLHLWVVIGVSVGFAILLLLFLISLWLVYRRASIFTTYPASQTQKRTLRFPSKGNPHYKIDQISVNSVRNPGVDNKNSQVELDPLSVPDKINGIEHQALLLPQERENPARFERIRIEMGKEGLRILRPENFGGGGSVDLVAATVPEVSHLGWGHWYTLRELEAATNGFSDANVIGEGGYGIVYYGVLEDNTQVAVKNLLNNRGQAEKEFKVEVEAIGRVRHKCLVRLLGYCAEGVHRILVYEYVDNGNLEQWLHGDVGSVSPLTWEIRMNIILGTAKGLTYLHEGLEPKVIHRDIKSSNILLDKQWNAKVSDFGLAKLLGSENNYITTRVMGTFGYVSPEYASTGMLNERSDVYSFGILVMEIISGRDPVDYSRPPGEVNLVDWLKTMVANRNPEGVLDPKLPEKPSPRMLKRALLIALRCIDPNALKRPKMGQVVHMLEAEESSSTDDHKVRGNFEGTHSLESQGCIGCENRLQE